MSIDVMTLKELTAQPSKGWAPLSFLVRIMLVILTLLAIGFPARQAMAESNGISIEIDLQRIQKNAETAKALLEMLRAKYEVEKWEYTNLVRIAPFEIPHSHPVLTLNSRNAVGRDRDEDAFLSVYVHEQIHWGLVIHRNAEVTLAIQRLKDRYPDAYTSQPNSAADEQSTYLHFVVNWLELTAVSELIGLARAEGAVLRSPVYKQIYRTVIRDYERIGSLLKETGVLPFPQAM